MIFGKLLNRLKQKRGSLSDRVVEGLDVMGGMPRDMMPRRGSGIMDGMRNRRFFDRFRNRIRPIRPIDEMPVSLLPRVELGQGTVPGFQPPDPEMMRPDPGRAFPGFKDRPIEIPDIQPPDPTGGKQLPSGERMVLPEPEIMPIESPVKELKPVRPLPDLSLLRPEDRRRFLENRPMREQMPVMLLPDVEVGEQLPPPELSPEAIAGGIQRPRMLPGMRGFSEGGIASLLDDPMTKRIYENLIKQGYSVQEAQRLVQQIAQRNLNIGNVKPNLPITDKMAKSITQFDRMKDLGFEKARKLGEYAGMSKDEQVKSIVDGIKKDFRTLSDEEFKRKTGLDKSLLRDPDAAKKVLSRENLRTVARGLATNPFKMTPAGLAGTIVGGAALGLLEPESGMRLDPAGFALEQAPQVAGKVASKGARILGPLKELADDFAEYQPLPGESGVDLPEFFKYIPDPQQGINFMLGRPQDTRSFKLALREAEERGENTFMFEGKMYQIVDDPTGLRKTGVEIEPEGMEQGGAVKLSEQSVEFMPGTDFGMMLDDLSDLKKKAQMMS